MSNDRYHIHGGFTAQTQFYGDSTPAELMQAYGSPLYVYNEDILRRRCRELTGLVDHERFEVNYSAKANSNPQLLSIVKEEGLRVDAMSPGEIHIELTAGFKPQDILYICNNVSAQEMRFATERGVRVSVDSLSQLELFGQTNPGGEVAIRFNPGSGAGHHAKVVTAGKKTKFGVSPDDIPTVKAILARHRLRLAGVNQHIGSLFMTGETYLEAAQTLMTIATSFDEIDFIDFGGGFGVPYKKLSGQPRLDLKELGKGLTRTIERFEAETGWTPRYHVEPGRYICAECGVLLGTVHAVKDVAGNAYAGTDLGFNVLSRPVLYDSHHDIEAYRGGDTPFGESTPVTVVGNICETGDIIAKDRMLPELIENDILAVLDAGAYGYVMSSNYNCRLRPAEVLIQSDGQPRLIRRADTLEDLLAPYGLAS
ncbi:diaminopimelate decarboxylase [Desulfovibrio ferrophilus]|uniref:Diaminopimelate decarboxylase n=1 Tax=Desulfovibrio ferrophilus TaxID=241368 RepID=A0A2Z6AZC9_9BACT|nr:diaminopimelate decarboxylase [Desulfovibrio ferrophilus]BBD08602.1 diaminopimelate decarboxylase [Desulfovibrio ferrophilus]